MMNKLVVATLLAAVALIAARPAEAVTRFRAIIENEQEVANPPVPDQTPHSGGMGVFELNDSMTALSYDITLFGLDIDGLQTPNSFSHPRGPGGIQRRHRVWDEGSQPRS